MIPFMNNSSKTLYVWHEFDTKNSTIDTSLNIRGYIMEPSNGHKVLPNTLNTTCLSIIPRNCFEGYPNIIIFILNEAIITNTSINTIETNYMILQRYDLTPTDLQKLDWQVSYPPTEAMKDIKMYPPYNSEE
jgi:hypothetical protein